MSKLRTADLFNAFSSRNFDDAREIGRQVSADGGHKLMADAIDAIEAETGDVRAAAWVSRRWTGITLPDGGVWP